MIISEELGNQDGRYYIKEDWQSLTMMDAED
jgi:hypothetical protein